MDFTSTYPLQSSTHSMVCAHILSHLNDKNKKCYEGSDVIKVDRKTGVGFRIATVHFKGNKVIFKRLK